MHRFLVLVLALHASLLSSQQPKVLAPHKPIPPRVMESVHRRDTEIPRSVVGGFWMIDANRNASIYLRNGLETSSLTVTPNLYLSNGAKFRLRPLTLAALGTAVVSINEALDQQGVSSAATLSGYVEVEYTWAWDPLCVTVTSTDPIHSVIFNSGFQPSVVADLQVRMLKHQVGGMHVVDGMWWKPEPGVTGFVALSNTTREPVTARVQFSDSADKVMREYQTRVSPHGTKIVTLDGLSEASAGSAGGLRVLHTGSVEGLLINGVMEDQSTGYSANLPLHYNFTPAPQSTGQETYAELGLMTGAADPMMQFPAGTVFTPFSVARNVSHQPMSVTPRFFWMQDGTAHSARLEPITLAPGEARTFELSFLLARAGLSAFNGSVNLILEAEGMPHSLLLAGGSVDRRNTYVFQVFPRAVQESTGKTISYWSSGNGDDTMVTIWNPADEPQDYRFTLFFGGGHYQLPVHLEARATHAFNVSEIIQNQIPDQDGNLIPTAVHEGSAEITGAQAHNETILVAVDAGTYNVRKATCSYYCISCDGEVLTFLVVTPFSIGKGAQTQLSFMAQDNHGYQYTIGGTWSSSLTSVATVSGINNGYNGQVTAVSPGTSKFSAYTNSTNIYNSYYCAYDPFCPDMGYAGSPPSPGTVAPQITSIAPNWGKEGANVAVTISGTGFGTAPTVGFSGTGIVASYSTRSDTKIVAIFTIAASAPVGVQGVTVTNNTQVDGGKGTSAPAGFQVTPSTATPVNFRQTSAADAGSGDLRLQYAWDSSTGNLADLSSCTVGEIVTYPGSQNPFPFPSPPFPPDAYTNPTVINLAGTAGGFQDDHKLTPSTTFVKPYSSSSFTATQYYRYRCSSGSYVNVAGPNSIVRSVSQNTNGSWKFTVTKSGASATINPLP